MQEKIKEYDQEKFFLGKLCIRGHEWHNTKKTLRKKNSVCLQCSCVRARIKRSGNENRKTKIWSNEKIIDKIKNIHKKNIPINDFHIYKNYSELYSTAVSKRYFGSWKNAVNSSGINYESILLTRCAMGSDSNIYDSYEEALCGSILHYLKDNRIISNYQCQIKISKNRKWKCDFLITKNDNSSFYCEYDGCRELKLSKERTKKFLLEKEQYYRENNFNIVFVHSVLEFKKLFNLENSKNLTDYTKKTIRKNIIDILEKDFCDVMKKIHKIPRKEDYDKFGKYSSSTIRKYFGSFGLLQKRHIVLFEKKLKKDLEKDFLKVMKKINKIPTKKDYNSLGTYSSYMIQKHFEMFSVLQKKYEKKNEY